MTDARQDYELILQELLKLYPAMLNSGCLPPARATHSKVAHIAHGWFMRVQRGIEAILHLDELDYTEEGVAISRSVIEHVVALKWIAVEGNTTLTTIRFNHEESAKKLLKATERANWKSINLDEIRGAIASVHQEDRDTTNDQYVHFFQRNEAFGHIHALPGYYSSVARVHPTYESAMAYVEQLRNVALPQSKPTIWQTPFCTSELIEGILAYRQIFNPAPWYDELKPLVTRYFAVTDAVRAQDGLPAVEWNGTVENVLEVKE